MARQPLSVVKATLSLDEIARSLRISTVDAAEKFKDPRVASWFAEIWGETLFGYKRYANSNNPGSDAKLALGVIGRFEISVRCFNAGNIRFQKSKFIGSNRKGTIEDLIQSVEEVERVVLVDLRRFPTLSFYPIDSKAVLKLIRIGKLTLNGMTPRRFDAWSSEEFDLQPHEIDLPIPTAPVHLDTEQQYQT
jgi:hypothetical protein